MCEQVSVFGGGVQQSSGGDSVNSHSWSSICLCGSANVNTSLSSLIRLLILMRCKRIAPHFNWTWILTLCRIFSLAFALKQCSVSPCLENGNIPSIPSLRSLLCKPNTQVSTRDSCSALKRRLSAVDLFKGISKSVGTVTSQITYIYNST